MDEVRLVPSGQMGEECKRLRAPRIPNIFHPLNGYSCSMKKPPIIIFCIPNPKALWIRLAGLYNVWGGDAGSVPSSSNLLYHYASERIDVRLLPPPHLGSYCIFHLKLLHKLCLTNMDVPYREIQHQWLREKTNKFLSLLLSSMTIFITFAHWLGVFHRFCSLPW